MKEKNFPDDCLKAVGITNKGKRLEFKVNRNGYLFCPNRDLVSLEIPDGVEAMFCVDNVLTELIIPESVKALDCDMNVKGLDNIDWECDIRLY